MTPRITRAHWYCCYSTGSTSLSADCVYQLKKPHTAMSTLQLLTVYVTLYDHGNYSSCKFSQSKLPTTRACQFTCRDVTMHYILQMWDLQNKRFRQCVHVCLSVYLTIHLSVCLSFRLSVCLSGTVVHLSVCPSVHMSVSVCVSDCPSVCPCVCLSIRRTSVKLSSRPTLNSRHLGLNSSTPPTICSTHTT